MYTYNYRLNKYCQFFTGASLDAWVARGRVREEAVGAPRLRAEGRVLLKGLDSPVVLGHRLRDGVDLRLDARSPPKRDLRGRSGRTCRARWA